MASKRQRQDLNTCSTDSSVHTLSNNGVYTTAIIQGLQEGEDGWINQTSPCMEQTLEKRLLNRTTDAC